jgi:hypothetical protein
MGGAKGKDCDTVPLCFDCHTQYHNSGAILQVVPDDGTETWDVRYLRRVADDLARRLAKQEEAAT